MIRFDRSALLAAALAAPILLPVQAPAADLDCSPVAYTCSGFEPNWTFAVGGGSIAFTDPESPSYPSALELPACARVLASGEVAVSVGAPLDLEAVITEEECVEPDEEVQPYSVRVDYNQGAPVQSRRISGTGCCWR